MLANILAPKFGFIFPVSQSDNFAVRGVEKATSLTNTAGLRAALLRPAHGQHRARRHSPERCVTFVQKHGLMQTIAGFPSNLFALMKIQLKNMRICVSFHQLCNAN